LRKKVKEKKCRCGLKTNQKDGICVVCKSGVTRLIGELEFLNKIRVRERYAGHRKIEKKHFHYI